MDDKRALNLTMLLALGGTLFSGYLSLFKLISKTCAFNEPCPYFLGYPACWYGFVLFVALLVLASLAATGRSDARRAWRNLVVVSGLGVLFAGKFVIQEVVAWVSMGRVIGYGLGLSTCVYGFAFFVVIFGLAAYRATRTRQA